MYKTILHATDLGNQHFHLCEKAYSLAKFFHAKLYFIHVIELPTSLQVAQGLGFTQLALPGKDDALMVMQVLGENFQLPMDNLLVETGSIAEQVELKAKLLQIDLIIIGQHQGGITHLGNHSQSIIRQAPCDVVTIKYQDQSI
jgi:universal stress protein A